MKKKLAFCIVWFLRLFLVFDIVAWLGGWFWYSGERDMTFGFIISIFLIYPVIILYQWGLDNMKQKI
jgi:hypothetical protein